MKRTIKMIYLVSTLSMMMGYAAGLSAEQSTSDDDEMREIKEQLAMVLDELRALRTEVQLLTANVNAARPPGPRTVNAPPSTTVPNLILDPEGHVLGDANAKVAIVEFSDFQCPYCRRFHDQTFELIKRAYVDTGKVQYVFRDFPLRQIHPQAKPAAIAARCAGAQGSYWEMHDALFAEQSQLGPATYTALATRLGLDVETFGTCLEDPTKASDVDKDLAYGKALGVRGTPHYFVGTIDGTRLTNVRRLSGAQSFAAFGNVLEQILH